MVKSNVLVSNNVIGVDLSIEVKFVKIGVCCVED